MRKKLKTYECLVTFRSKALKKRFQPGDRIQAPASIGQSWVSLNLAKETSTSK